MAKDNKQDDMPDVDLTTDLTDESNTDIQRTLSDSDKQQDTSS